MPSLKEMLAAKAAKAAKPATDLLGQPIGEHFVPTPDGPHYGKMLDKDNKFIKWVTYPQPRSTGIIARADKPDPAPAKQHGPLAEEPRTLGSTEKGADVPFEFASEKPSEAAKQWLAIRYQPETTLGIVVALDPSGETTAHAWLALESPADPGRLLYLYRLPLLAPKSDAGPF